MTAAPATASLAGANVQALAYEGSVLGPTLRLRPLLCNCSDQEVGNATQWSTKPSVEHLSAGIGRYLGC